MSPLHTFILVVILAIGFTGLIAAARAMRLVQQHERGVALHLRRVRDRTRGPGPTRMSSALLAILPALSQPERAGRVNQPTPAKPSVLSIPDDEIAQTGGTPCRSGGYAR